MMFFTLRNCSAFATELPPNFVIFIICFAACTASFHLMINLLSGLKGEEAALGLCFHKSLGKNMILKDPASHMTGPTKKRSIFCEDVFKYPFIKEGVSKEDLLYVPYYCIRRGISAGSPLPYRVSVSNSGGKSNRPAPLPGEISPADAEPPPRFFRLFRQTPLTERS